MSVFSKHWKKRVRQVNEFVASNSESDFTLTTLPDEEDRKCPTAHVVNGVIPKKEDIQFDGMACDCGKILYYQEICTCPLNPHYELHSKPNE